MRAPLETVPRIGQHEAYARFKDGSAIFVDVRSSERYGQSHIPDARSIPLRLHARELLNLPRDRTIITY